ncbi:phage minor head protein [Pseudoalteromonas sp. Of7M-16]|uniref:phage head morphogenesis protein n=1 Tax=Pseudoalteromonas sp. Of7M-16 TaxID=2917756 RepID=UPI001EF4805E|nr:phage minor head protein [Pseudoalteromonas sp. Of7M-16]MCG7551366.1 minor capsid protein [Pseudoalteromonas sp. Of7M-16]
MDDLLLADAVLLQQMIDLEGQYARHSARILQDEITARFTKRTPLGQTHAKGFAQLYASAMTVAWLYGQYHVYKQSKSPDPIELSNDMYEVSFGEAEEHLRAQVPINKDDYAKLEASLKFRAFTIAKIGQESVIQKIKGMYQAQLKEGHSAPHLLQNLNQLLDAAGVTEANPGWLHTHYRNNMMAAYNAGRWAQIEQNEHIEYLIYNAILDGHTTELCKKLHGTTKPKKDRFWNTFHPTNHHNCRSIVSAATKAQLKSRKITVSSTKTADIYKNPTAKREHQFKAHPGAALKTIPNSLAIRAIQYGLGEAILKYTATSNRGFFSTRIADLSKSKLSKAAINHATNRRPELSDHTELAQAAISDADEAWLAFSPRKSGEFDASIVVIKWQDEKMKTGMAVGFRAFDGGPRTFYTMTNNNYEGLKRHGAQQIYVKSK